MTEHDSDEWVDQDDVNVPVDIGLTDMEVSDLERLIQLREQRDQLTDEIEYLTEQYVKRIGEVGARVAMRGAWAVRAVKPKDRYTVKPRDLSKIELSDPELAGRISERRTSTARLQSAMRMGYFAPGTPEHQYLTVTQVKPHLRFSTYVPREETA